MIAGHPGLGKSQITVSMAAIISTGGMWPVDRVHAEKGNVIILSAEDDVADTIRPRLEAAGADLDKIFILEAIREWTAEGDKVLRSFNIKTDVHSLEAMLADVGNVSLVIIDPVTAYLGATDSHRTSDVRALLAPLSAMAGEHKTAIVCVSHLNKSGSSEAMLRITGSLAFVAAARAAYLVAKDSDTDQKLFIPMKNNIGNDQDGLSFSIEGYTLNNNIETSRIVWNAEPVSVSADEVLLRAVDPEDRSQLDEAKLFLIDLLTGNPLPAKQVYKDAENAGHSKRTIVRAKEALSIKPRKTRFDGQWEWALPDKQHDQDGHQDTVGNVGTLGTLGEERDKKHEECQECQECLSGEDGHLQKVRCPQCHNYDQTSGCRVGTERADPFCPEPCANFEHKAGIQ